MIKKPPKCILFQKCMKKILMISGVISLLLLQGTFQLFALSGSDIRMSEDLQQIVVTGTVVDASNNPLVGVNVREKGTTNGTLTSVDGKYSINVSSPKSIIDFSFIGFESQEVTVGTQISG